MKATLALFVFILTSGMANAAIEFGDHIECQKMIGNYYPQLNIEIIAPPVPYRTDGIIKFNVSAWGHSRNTYAATYLANIEAKHDRIGYAYHLKKWKDHSTWSDMPEKLSLHSLNGSFLFQGEIPGEGFIKTYLNKENCNFN